MRKCVYVFISCIVLLSMFLSAGWLRSREEFDIVPVLEDADKTQYILHQAELIPRDDITAFVVDEDHLYVLYDNVALVNVYDMDGTFQYGIQISTIKNGHSNITVANGILYFYSRRPIIFAFQGTQLLEAIDPDKHQDRYLEAKALFSKEDNFETYDISASGNTIIDKNTQESIIELPQKSKSADYLTIAGLFLLFLSLHGYARLFKKSHANNKQKRCAAYAAHLFFTLRIRLPWSRGSR